MVRGGHIFPDKPVKVVRIELAPVARAHFHIPDQTQIHDLQVAPVRQIHLLNLSASHAPALRRQTHLGAVNTPLFPAAQHDRGHDPVSSRIQVLPPHDLGVRRQGGNLPRRGRNYFTRKTPNGFRQIHDHSRDRRSVGRGREQTKSCRRSTQDRQRHDPPDRSRPRRRLSRRTLRLWGLRGNVHGLGVPGISTGVFHFFQVFANPPCNTHPTATMPPSATTKTKNPAAI